MYILTFDNTSAVPVQYCFREWKQLMGGVNDGIYTSDMKETNILFDTDVK